MTTPLDIHEYLLTNSPWVDREKTVDAIKCGDPDREVTRAGVCWFPAIENLRAASDLGCELLVTHEIENLRAASDLGCELLVTHEPLLYDHQHPETLHSDEEPSLAKRRLLDESGLVVLRAHDSWDQWPEIGIRESWARGLGITDLVCESEEHRFHGLYRIPETPLRELAQHIADRVAALGEDAVQVIGDPDRRVSRPALGVGCLIPGREMIERGADVIVACYDGATYWQFRERFHALGAAVITVEHGTSEIWGIRSLHDHLAEVFPDIEWHWLDHHARTWTVRGQVPAGENSEP